MEALMLDTAIDCSMCIPALTKMAQSLGWNFSPEYASAITNCSFAILLNPVLLFA